MDETQYLLTVLSEEAVEVSHAAHKVIRFTPHDSHTIGGPTNLENLEKEYNDLIAMVEMLAEKGIVIGVSRELIAKKKQRVLDYMAYSRQLGVVK